MQYAVWPQSCRRTFPSVASNTFTAAPFDAARSLPSGLNLIPPAMLRPFLEVSRSFARRHVDERDSIDATEDHRLAVWAERQIADPALLLKAAYLLSSAGVPDPDRVILAVRDQLLAIRAEGHVAAKAT